jgi:DNA repair exonuclease SbcCD ATPase subunit
MNEHFQKKADALQNAENEKRVRILQRENEALKERLQNIEVLKEEILSLKQQLENKEKELSQAIKMKVYFSIIFLSLSLIKEVVYSAF